MVAEVDETYGVFIHDNTGNLIEIFEEKGNWWEQVQRQSEKL